MKLLAAFLKLIRSLNLLFIAVTQLLFQYCIVVPALKQAGLPVQVGDGLFVLLMLASICIAAGGYIINDYFDLNIDRVNKPDKLVVEKLFLLLLLLYTRLVCTIISSITLTVSPR